MRKIITVVLLVMVFIIILIFGINGYVIIKSQNKIIKSDSFSIDNVDCILVLGAGIWGDKPSPMLEDRLKEAIKLYNSGISKKIIMSGDHGRNDHDEVNIMKDYAISNGVPSEDIFMDHAGFSTYDSMYRAKEIFGVNKMIVVTQKYHLYRAVYIANKLGIDAYGKNSDPRLYAGQTYRELREIVARDKDFFTCVFKPKSKYLGDTIPVSGNGDITNDKK